MKKNILAVLIASSIGLYGCGDESEVTGNPTIDPIIEKSLKAETKIAFDLASKTLVLPTFLAMDSTDGTLSVEGTVGSDEYSTNLLDPQTAMGKTDGWSTTQPIVIEFTGNELDADSAKKGFYLIESKDPTDEYDSTEAVLLSEADNDFTVKASGSTLTVVLLKPLKPASNYMFAVTDELKDVKGNSVGMTGSYATLKATVEPALDELIPAQTITHATEKELEIAGVNADSIIYSSWFTTHSAGDTLFATKAAIAQGLAVKNLSAIWKDDAKPQNLDLSLAYTINPTSLNTLDYAAALSADTNFTKYLDDTSDTQKTTLLGIYSTTPNTINVTSGTVNLPYFLEKGADWASTSFQSAMPSLAKLFNILATPDSADAQAIGTQLAAKGINPALLATDQSEQLKLIGLTLKKADGTQLDEERLVTKYSPVPKIKSLEPVPFLLFTPTGSTGPLQVVIYQHGITSVKENSYAFASNLAKNNVAVIAIDNPLHGSRSLDDQRSANADIKAYLNLSNLTVARDNIRQSMFDIIGLRASLTASQTAGIFAANTELSKLAPNASATESNTSFLGHSLGGVVGAPAVVAANRTLGSDAGDALFDFKSSAFANSGGDIGNLLFGSESFGSLIRHNLMLSSSTDYQNYAKAACTDTSLEHWENKCFDDFYSAAPDTAKTEMGSTFASFIYAAQSIIGTADPINVSQLTDTSGKTILETTPMYMMQVANDDTVPNKLATAPLAGTEPMAALFGLASLAETTTGIKHFAKFNTGASGTHNTAVAPGAADLNAHKEIQSQLIQFYTLDGQIPSVTTGLLE